MRGMGTEAAARLCQLVGSDCAAGGECFCAAGDGGMARGTGPWLVTVTAGHRADNRVSLNCVLTINRFN